MSFFLIASIFPSFHPVGFFFFFSLSAILGVFLSTHFEDRMGFVFVFALKLGLQGGEWVNWKLKDVD